MANQNPQKSSLYLRPTKNLPTCSWAPWSKRAFSESSKGTNHRTFWETSLNLILTHNSSQSERATKHYSQSVCVSQVDIPMSMGCKQDQISLCRTFMGLKLKGSAHCPKTPLHKHLTHVREAYQAGSLGVFYRPVCRLVAIKQLTKLSQLLVPNRRKEAKHQTGWQHVVPI